jgi:hypothetical protein
MINGTIEVKMVVKKLGISLLMWMTLSVVYALPPEAPLLSLEIEGLEVSATWNYADDVSGYRLVYAYAPHHNDGPLEIGPMQTIELGTQASFTETLKNGDGFYVALQAYNAEGNGPLSNIEHFMLDKRIIVLLPTTADAALEEGIKKAFADKGTEQRVRLEIVNSWSNNEQLKKMFYGVRQTDEESGIRGYIDDPNVLAIVTGNMENTLAVTSQLRDDSPLIVACTATSTLVQGRQGLLLMAPSNFVQGDMMHQQLSIDAENDDRMYKYAVILGNEPSTVISSVDLYSHLLRNIFLVEAVVQIKGGLDNDGKVQPFAQTVGTFTFDGTEAQAEKIAGVMDQLAPDAAIYVGASSSFKTLYDKSPNLKWLVSDGSYKYEDFKGGDVRRLTFGGGNSQDIYQNLGYDVGGFLAEVIDKLGDSELERTTLLEDAEDITYEGLTGTKGFGVEENGWYEILKIGDDGWEKVE